MGKNNGKRSKSMKRRDFLKDKTAERGRIETAIRHDKESGDVRIQQAKQTIMEQKQTIASLRGICHREMSEHRETKKVRFHTHPSPTYPTP